MVTTFGSNITKAFTFGQEVSAIYSYGVKVFPAEPQKQWVPKEWNIDLDGSDIWHDNDGHIYYSNGSDQYELVNGTWMNKTWEGFTPSHGRNIWTHDNHLHYSADTVQYRLDSSGWVEVNWNGFFGYDVWHDNDGNTYHTTSNGYNYILESVESDTGDGYRWVRRDWNIIHITSGWDVWHSPDGHIYFSGQSQGSNRQYELVDGNWVPKTWRYKPTYGRNVWTDNDGNTYYSNGKYDTVTKQFSEVIIQLVAGQFVWKDNDGHIYYSNGSTHYELVEINN